MLHDSHYVSRFLTKPWEDDQRRLIYVDLDAQEIKRKSSKTLLAEPEGLDTEMETLFGKFIETPVGVLRKQWLDTGKCPEPRRWEEFRALFLLLALQGPRYVHLCRRPRESTGIELLRADEVEIDQIATALRDQYNVVTIVIEDGRLFMPESGAFPFFVHDRGCATGFTLATGIPLHPQILLAMVSKSVTEDVLAWEAQHLGHIVSLSAGAAAGMRRVVVPHEVLLGEGEKGTVRYVTQAVARNQMLLRKVQEARAIAVGMWETAGMKLSERQVGDPILVQWTKDTLVLE